MTLQDLQDGLEYVVALRMESQSGNILADSLEEDLLLILSVDHLHKSLHRVSAHGVA